MEKKTRQQLIDWEQRELPISTQAQLLSLNRTSLYYQPMPPSAREVALKHRIDEMYTANPYYGYRRVAAHLSAYLRFYNEERLHQSLDYITPAEVYFGK